MHHPTFNFTCFLESYSCFFFHSNRFSSCLTGIIPEPIVKRGWRIWSRKIMSFAKRLLLFVLEWKSWSRWWKAWWLLKISHQLQPLKFKLKLLWFPRSSPLQHLWLKSTLRSNIKFRKVFRGVCLITSCQKGISLLYNPWFNLLCPFLNRRQLLCHL